MTDTVRSLIEEGLAIGWFILSTQTKGTTQKICFIFGAISFVFALFYALK